MLCGIVRFIPRGAEFFKPVAMKGVQTLLKVGSEAIKKGATVTNVIKSALKSTVGAVLGATVDPIASKFIEMRYNQIDAPSFNVPILVHEFVQEGLGKTRRCRSVYKKTTKHTKNSSVQRPIIYNF